LWSDKRENSKMADLSPKLTIFITVLTGLGVIAAANLTASSQYDAVIEQIKSDSERVRQDRRQDAYADFYASLVAKREALVAMRCADQASGNVVDRDQQLVLDAAAKDADASWNRSWSRTDLYASNNLRTAVRDLRFSEQSTHFVKGSGGLQLLNPGSAEKYAKCEATLAGFDTKVVAIRETIQKDLGMGES
jgi:hypothetical protein